MKKNEDRKWWILFIRSLKLWSVSAANGEMFLRVRIIWKNFSIVDSYYAIPIRIFVALQYDIRISALEQTNTIALA